MFIILVTILTTSAARTTHNFVNIESNSRHNSDSPVLDLSFKFENGNGDQLVSTNSYPKEHELKASDVVFPGHGSNIHRRVDSNHSYQYRYENSNGHWNRTTVTEATQLSDRFEDNVKEENVFDFFKEKSTQKPGTVVKVNEYGQYNRPQNDSKNISKQLQDLNVKQQDSASNYTESNNTTINPNSTNLNTPRKLNLYPTIIYQNNSSVDQSSINPYQNSVKNIKNINTDNRTKTNTTESYNGTMFPNINLDIGGTYGAKTAQDNEVKGGDDGDRWIWSNVETTTLVPLDDRAAFAGNNCPAGTVRIRDRCIAED
ncbi:unnamed protein product [Arctia plantaginis]|uniref:Uncharacterized protein n=1 Tax=Arctia plantaginis TaxID=874455 RepID=A0A8S0ZG72_ARCPL|nr:unnamed protein product [Arctia plantaginis]CAB3232350.1 unnamed protein product [Arctia plantaginis]